MLFQLYWCRFLGGITNREQSVNWKRSRVPIDGDQIYWAQPKYFSQIFGQRIAVASADTKYIAESQARKVNSNMPTQRLSTTACCAGIWPTYENATAAAIMTRVCHSSVKSSLGGI